MNNENSSNSRRDFIKKAGLGAATITLGGLAFPGFILCPHTGSQ